jgi:hypothetical protein
MKVDRGAEWGYRSGVPFRIRCVVWQSMLVGIRVTGPTYGGKARVGAEDGAKHVASLERIPILILELRARAQAGRAGSWMKRGSSGADG